MTENRTVGFLGLIPTDYQCDGKKLNAHAATTWRVDPEFRSSSLPMLLKLRSLSRKVPIVDTSPSETVNELFDRLKFCMGATRPGASFSNGAIAVDARRRAQAQERLHGFVIARRRRAVRNVAESSSRDFEKRYSYGYLKWLVEFAQCRISCSPDWLNANNTLQALLLFEDCHLQTPSGHSDHRLVL